MYTILFLKKNPNYFLEKDTFLLAEGERLREKEAAFIYEMLFSLFSVLFAYTELLYKLPPFQFHKETEQKKSIIMRAF